MWSTTSCVREEIRNVNRWNGIFSVSSSYFMFSNLPRPRDCWFVFNNRGNTNIWVYALLGASWSPTVKHDNISRGQVHLVSLANLHIWSSGNGATVTGCGLKMVDIGHTGWLIRVLSPWPSHWFQVYVMQGQSVSCKTGMGPGVYGAKSNVQRMRQG